MVDSSYYEFVGPDFSSDSHCNAKYRAHREVVELADGTSMYHQQPTILRVPSRLEALANDGTWQQHPVVFLHGDGFDRQLVMFLDGGKWCSLPYRPFATKEHNLYRYAQRHGLTEGRRFNIAGIPKEGK